MAAHRPSLVVELGTHNGFSYFVFCDAVVRLGLDARTYAVDTWEGDVHAGFYGEDVFAAVKQVNDAEYGSFSTLLRMTFDEALSRIQDGSVDLLHLDGRHRYEDVRHDFESWLPKLSSRGVVLFHDIAERREDFGVWRYWEELSDRWPSFAFEHGHGLGVLGVGDAGLSPQMAEFFSAADHDGDVIRSTYAALGAREESDLLRESELRHAAERDRRRIETLEKEKAALEGALESARRDVVDVEAALDATYASTSWKVTRPLRALGSAVRRG
ncbi:class I SAM-dependent methyltransferase [Agromyces humi]|uniref:class I SAM-dependent methyltransferase n=1 Tax=Agromyces humi TaxID=1766800 RepID=UPI001F3492E5|nr:class I SAM-dependent methyltransferase [Agromyces humi]